MTYLILAQNFGGMGEWGVGSGEWEMAEDSRIGWNPFSGNYRQSRKPFRSQYCKT
ncbi:hypothetical protein [Limnofasciculus baicalensis]|uniref:Uncharacterized protein n=1 Tax=Limnofasciculus baicalensis BBK-W-15 TaxID=2699891 RepID=A0AAE3GS19_9CYAN|nr:hypothetical protein [Limnofasciculus baicalensis]MCP2729279.1 hypothetical protein [Limnofasciculus baicalensis BBK-W-15]